MWFLSLASLVIFKIRLAMEAYLQEAIAFLGLPPDVITSEFENGGSSSSSSSSSSSTSSRSTRREDALATPGKKKNGHGGARRKSVSIFIDSLLSYCVFATQTNCVVVCAASGYEASRHER